MATKKKIAIPVPESEKRIYCVVAQTVQAPLQEKFVYTSNFGGVNIWKPFTTEATQTIKQPPGRIVAQHGHAVSKVRSHMLKSILTQLLNDAERGNKQSMTDLMEGVFTTCHEEFKPITTIVLGVRNSFELYHVLGLLRLAEIPVHTFYDTEQPDYGDPTYKVMTAIATEPIDPEESTGILDYLPLWGSQYTK